MLIIVSTVFKLNSGFWMHRLEYLYVPLKACYVKMFQIYCLWTNKIGLTSVYNMNVGSNCQR